MSTCVGENLNQTVSMYVILYLMNMLAISNKIFLNLILLSWLIKDSAPFMLWYPRPDYLGMSSS